MCPHDNLKTIATRKGKGKGLVTCYGATCMSQTRDQQSFTISEVAAEPMVPQRIMWLSIARINGIGPTVQLADLTGMSQWCRSALCGHPLPALTDSWTHDAASRHTIAQISHTRPSPRSHSHYSFPVPLRVPTLVLGYRLSWTIGLHR